MTAQDGNTASVSTAEERVRRLEADLLSAYDGDPAAVQTFKSNLDELVSIAARAEELEANLPVAEKACNICSEPWPHHHESCAYPSNVRRMRKAEARAKEYREAAVKLAEDLLAIAELTMLDSYFESDARCVFARGVLGREPGVRS